MRYLSLFHGIGAVYVAWEPLGWECAAYAEIEPFPIAVSEAREPGVPNLGDVTKITDEQIAALGPLDLVVGGSPCQDLSVAGKRAGLAGERSGLFHEQMRIFHAARALCGARFLLWENVPGAFSSHRGRDFGIVVGSMAGCELGVPSGGWGTCGAVLGENGLVEWRVLDAQHVRVQSHPRAVPQRRRRVFALLDTGAWRDRPPILLEPEGLRGHPAPRREAGEGASADAQGCAAVSSGHGWWDESDVGACVRAQDSITKADTLATHSLRAECFDASEDGPGRWIPLVPEVVGALSDGAHMGGGSTARTPIQAESSRCLNAGGMGRRDWETETFVLEPIGGGFDAASAYDILGVPATQGAVATDCHTPLRARQPGQSEASTTTVVVQPIPFDTTQITSAANYSRPQPGDPVHPLAAHAHAPAIAFHNRQDPDISGDVTHPLCAKDNGFGIGVDCYNDQITGDVAATMDTPGSSVNASGPTVMAAMQVRRLTPRECERLQGFPDDYTLVTVRGKPAADGPRYRALGNSMAVNVMRWIGERIQSNRDRPPAAGQ